MAKPRDFEALLAAIPALPIVTIVAADAAADVARALVRGGIAAIEVTLRTPAAIDAIRAITRRERNAIEARARDAATCFKRKPAR